MVAADMKTGGARRGGAASEMGLIITVNFGGAGGRVGPRGELRERVGA